MMKTDLPKNPTARPKRPVYIPALLLALILSLLSQTAATALPSLPVRTGQALAPFSQYPTNPPFPIGPAFPTHKSSDFVNTSNYAERLYQASLHYLADSPDEADQVAKALAFNKGRYESAKNACGPLSIAILRDAGILPASASLHEIWLLCPKDAPGCNDRHILEREYFPPSEYDYIWFEESVGTFDFKTDPLQAGDWLYLVVTTNGFDHMIVVSRVDADGKAYTVTNLNRGEGFNISEELLYDPQDPEAGLFKELTNPKRKYLGMSGDDRFLRVRRQEPYDTLPPLNDPLDAVLAKGAIWNGAVKEIGTSEYLYKSLPNQKFHPASMIKVPLAMVVLDYFEQRGYHAADLKDLKSGSSAMDWLLQEMIVRSDEKATQALLTFIGGPAAARKTLTAWGLEDTFFDPRTTTVFDLSILLEGLYSGSLLSADMRAYLLELMTVYTEKDDAYLGVLNRALPGSVFYNKRGSMLEPLVLGDMGILTYQDKAYVVILCGRPDEIVGSNLPELTTSIEAFATTLGSLLR